MFGKLLCCLAMLIFSQCLASVPKNCFNNSSGPYGFNYSTYFSDVCYLMSEQMTPDMRISSVTACSDPKSL